jgi:hypothetical protein
MHRARPIPATVELRLKDPRESGAELIPLSTCLYQAGYIFAEPRELRRHTRSSDTLELICTFENSEATRLWLKDPWVEEHFGEKLRRTLRSAPKVVRCHDVIHDVENQRTCSCKKRSCLLFAQSLYWRRGPAICGDCRAPIPRYRLPKDYGCDVWTSTYDHIQEIWLDSDGPLERWARDGLRDYHSVLSQAGRKHARQLAKYLGVPVYYLLWVEEPDIQLSCPNCGAAGRESPWENPPRICRRCKIAF